MNGVTNENSMFNEIWHFFLHNIQRNCWKQNEKLRPKLRWKSSSPTVLKIFRCYSTNSRSIINNGFSWLNVFVVKTLSQLINNRNSSDHILHSHFSYSNHFAIETNGFRHFDRRFIFDFFLFNFTDRNRFLKEKKKRQNFQKENIFSPLNFSNLTKHFSYRSRSTCRFVLTKRRRKVEDEFLFRLCFIRTIS